MNQQRTRDFASQDLERAGGVVDPVPDDMPQFIKDYHAYYKTNRAITLDLLTLIMVGR